jgi:RHS repeat-associated protein
MKRSDKLLRCFLLLCLFLHLPAFATEDDAKDEPAIFTSEQLSALTSDEDGLIGGLISPLSGIPCLRQIDFTVIGAQEISLSRVYVSPYMPHLFHKHWDADCYHRRKYLMRHYEGWKFFPHQHLWLDATKKEVHLINPSAATYDFRITGSSTTLLHPYAASNLGGEELPSGKFDPKNTRISYENSCFTVFSPDGSTRYYRHKRGTIFLLNKEILPNGKVLRYQYTDAGQLSLVESLDPKERYVYASIRVQGTPQEGRCNFTSSTGLSAFYTFENQRVQGKFKEGKKKIEYIFPLPPLMTAVNSPQYRGEISTHSSPNFLLQSFAGKDETFTLNHAPFGDGNRAHLRVDKLLLPVGTNDAFIPVYQMSYQPAIAGEREGKTTVKNSDGTSTIYHFSKNLLTTLVQYFEQDGSLKKEKLFSWNDKNWLVSIELKDENKQLLLRKNYEYDRFGNPITETLTGDLTGDNREDHYLIKREFSQDGRNLLLKEETQDGKITIFEYLPKTDLVTLKLIKDGNRVLIRETFQYDDCHNLTQKCIDDNNSQKRITNYILRQQQPFLHMPEWIEEKYFEKGDEKLLKRNHLSYDQYGNVSEKKVHDANGQYAYSIFKEYNERGDLLSETNPLGQKRTFAYDNKGRCIEETNFSQNLNEEKRYDTKGRLLEEKTTGEDGVHNVAYQYNRSDDLIQKIDTYGNAFSYTYDSLSHKVSRTDSPAILTSDGQSSPVATYSTYDPWGREISKTDANGNTTHYRYNAYDSPTEITYPNGSKEIYRYTKDGRKASYTDREGLTIYYIHDVLDRVTSKSYGKNLGKENFLYDSFNLLEESDLEGNTSHYFYDGIGRKICEENSGRTTAFGYDALGRLAEIRNEDLRTHLKRDLADRLVEETKTDLNNSLLYKVGFAYDEDNNLNKIIRYIDGKESVESFVYDYFGRVTLHRDPLKHKTTTFYNENYTNDLGQRVLQITSVDPLNISKIKTQDPYSRDVQEKILNPQGATISCWDKIYNPQGNLTDWKDYLYENEQLKSIQIAHFAYTSDNKVKSSTRAFGTPEARTTLYTYTPGGKRETKALPNGIILTHTYTSLGFLETVSSSDGKIQHRFECNKNGELVHIIDEKEKLSIQREVDPFGNVTRETFSNGIEVTKSYDSFDRPQMLQIADIGHIAFTYDSLYLRSVSRFSKEGKLLYAHDYENYDLDGNLLLESLINNSGKIQHHIDLKGRKTEIASPYFSQKCLYDAGDNLTKSIVDQQSISYTYDELSQLTGEDGLSYAYDSLFNRKMKNGQQFEVNNLNEINELIYDLNGNQIQKGDIQYIYDPLNRLIEANHAKRKIYFQYDPLGRRLAKIVMEKTASGWREDYRENYLYDGKHEIGALAPDGTLKNFRTLAILHKQMPTMSIDNDDKQDIDDQKEDLQINSVAYVDSIIDLTIPTTVAVELNQKIFASITDAQRNICRLVDPFSKKIASQYDFTAFGEGENQNEKNPWRYAAKRFDPELNLIYFGKRYYDPELARWLTTDPVGFVDSLNLYQYVLNNPFRYYDPEGEFAFLIPLAIPFAQLLCGTAVASAVIDAVIVSAVAVVAWEGSKYVNNVIEKKSGGAEHTKHKRRSTKDKHDVGKARKQREQKLAQERRAEAKKKSKNRKGK